MARDSYTYLHLPMVAGIVLLALGIKKTVGHGGDALDAMPAFCLCGGVAMYLLAHVAFRWRNTGTIGKRRIATALICLALFPLGTAIPSLLTLALVARHRLPAGRLRGGALRDGEGSHPARHGVACAPMSSGARVIVDELERAGVEVCFGLPGVHNLALWEALRESSIRLVGVRHEQTAGYAADGYARATGRLGVALTTTGPGAANTLGAVGEAWASRSPILVIATDIPSTLRREGEYRGILHETDGQADMFAPVVKASFVAHAWARWPPRRTRRSRRRSRRRRAPCTWRCRRTCWPPRCRRRSGRRRPQRGGDHGGRPRGVAWHRCGGRSIAAVAALDGAERPLIWAGGGARDAGAAGRARWPRGSTRPCSPPTAPPASSPATRTSSGCRRMSSRPDGCGTRPTSCSPSAPTSTACRRRTSRSRSRSTLISIALEQPVNYRVDVALTGDAASLSAALARARGRPRRRHA